METKLKRLQGEATNLSTSLERAKTTVDKCKAAQTAAKKEVDSMDEDVAHIVAEAKGIAKEKTALGKTVADQELKLEKVFGAS